MLGEVGGELPRRGAYPVISGGSPYRWHLTRGRLSWPFWGEFTYLLGQEPELLRSGLPNAHPASLSSTGWQTCPLLSKAFSLVGSTFARLFLFPPLRLTQVRGSRYGPEYKDPQVDKEYYRKPLAELTEEEKYERELRKTQHIKAAPASKTSSVFEDPVIRSDGSKYFCSTDWDYTREGLQLGFCGILGLGNLNVLLFFLK